MSTRPIKFAIGSSIFVGLACAACSKASDKVTPEPMTGSMGGNAGATASAGGPSVGGSTGTGGTGSIAGAAGMGGTAPVGGAAGTAGAGIAGGNAGEAGHAPHTVCRTDLPGPKLVDVSPGPGDGFCMDATMVTAGQYQEFLKAKGGDTSGQRKECAWNTSFAPTPVPKEGMPGSGCPGMDMFWQPAAHPEWAMYCTDYCDALAYCAWAGKRLCGYLNGAQTYPPFQVDQSVNTDAPLRMELTYACSQGGKTAYHYGDQFDPSAGTDFTMDPAKVAKNAGKLPPFDQLSGFNGPVAQWEGGCDLSGDYCGIRGLGYSANPSVDAPLERCDSRYGTFWMAQGPSFRCCTD